MKKIFLTMFVLLSFLSGAFAAPEKEIQFIYINGSNNNDTKMKDWFFDGIQKMHPNMVNAFNSSSFIQANFLEQGRYSLSGTPETFFWGDKSSNQIKALNTDLSITKMFSPKLAQTVRSLIAHYLHDAIWVSHYRNMHPVVEDLHKQVMDNYNKNKQVVLFGYSAGSFITYEYMFNKLPIIEPVDFFKMSGISDNFIKYALGMKVNNTCIDALIDSNVVVYSIDGKLVPNSNMVELKNNYKKLDSYTCKSCIPKDALRGIVNFASPLVLFYSDVSDPNYSMTYYNKLLYKYLLENDMFWLTVNYSDDPLGYPTTKNISYADLKDRIDMDIIPSKGFLYSKSDVKSRKTFLGAHTSYWKTSKKFSKAVVKAYEDGFCLYNFEKCKENKKESD